MFSSPIFGSLRSRFGRRSVMPLVLAIFVGWFGVVAQPLAGKGLKASSSPNRSSITSCSARCAIADRHASSSARVMASSRRSRND